MNLRILLSLFLLLVMISCPTSDSNSGGGSTGYKEILPASPVSGSSKGFADLNGGTTGGTGGSEVTVDNKFDFQSAVIGTTSKIIYVNGSIELNQGIWINVGSNKSIIGINNAKLRYGGLLLSGVRNIIIKNITFHDAVTPGSGTEYDCISITDGSANIWIDHCTFSDDPVNDLSALHHDGLLDIKRGSNYITVSYCEFHNHIKTCLLGHSDDNAGMDLGKLKVTYHHNFFNSTNQRNPRVRFGRVHVYNNYYLSLPASETTSSMMYGIGIGDLSQIYAEGNYFEDAATPSKMYDDKDHPGYLKDVNNYLENSGVIVTKAASSPELIWAWSPDKYYNYTSDNANEPAENVKNICLTYSGADKPERP